ncbi:MAG: hypothetical protein KAJ23_06810 [Maribacter sp.]|nr:hypothetical protein [Maribacter sp.]
MKYLSPQIEAWSKRNITSTYGLVQKGYSCGIFQEYPESRLPDDIHKSK